MFTLIGRTFIAYEDSHLGRSIVGLLTQSQGNTNEDEWFSLLVNLFESNSKIYVGAFRGMAIDIDEVKSIIFHDDNQAQERINMLKDLILGMLQKFENKL